MEKLLIELARTVEETVLKSLALLREYIRSDSSIENLEERAKDVKKTESRADEIRNRIRSEIYKGISLPFTSKFYTEMLEKIDRIADISEDVALSLLTFSLSIPEELKPDFEELITKIEDAIKLLEINVKCIFEDFSKCKDTWEKIARLRTSSKYQIYNLRKKVNEIIDDCKIYFVLEKLLDKLFLLMNSIKGVSNLISALIEII